MTAQGPFLLGENELLRRIIEVTSSNLKLRDVVQQVAVLVAEATTSDVCFVHLLDEERKRIVLMGATPPFGELAGTVELALGEGVAGWVALHAEPAVVPDKWSDTRYRYIPALRGEDYESMASVPMLIRGERVVGVLNVHSREPRHYGEGDVALLLQVANLVARTVENARLYEQLAEREQALEHFAARTVEAQEMDRRRLAAEIHDGISQRLISLWYHLQAAEGAAPSDPATVLSELEAAKDLTSAALDETRTAIAGLRPSVLDDLGLGPSLESLARTVNGPELDLDVAACRLAPHVEVALYRIAQEALQNVVKHAGATRVAVTLTTTGDTVRLVVEDDGKGFGPRDLARERATEAYGLAGMRERAELVGARLNVTSRPGEGTRVQVEVPAAEPSST
ncbi:MAG TPA: GAF domain-containing protein [Acidimicrobiia bacterium]|nr:GAF domain-containing protein [Acidimicrobiia bacterium]